MLIILRQERIYIGVVLWYVVLFQRFKQAAFAATSIASGIKSVKTLRNLRKFPTNLRH